MIVFALLATFGLAFAGPLIHRLTGRWANWLLALAPAAWFVWLLTLLEPVKDGEPWTASVKWAPSLDVYASFYIDGLSLLMALIVTGVGALIMVYSGAYLGHNEKHIGRFYAFMLAFIAAMLGVVIADNVITLFVFWELTSILSFLLIGFKHTYEDSRKSAQQALVITGGGGLALLGGLVIAGVDSGQWELSGMRDAGYAGEGGMFAAALVLIVIGAFTKSAQVPFHGWLPNAMVAPTPVSAYLHSAAMVKAGIYLLARFYPIFSGSDLWQWLLIPAGLVTMFLGAWFAIRQDDLKRILAYTTLSALGTLTLLLGLGTEYGVKAAMVFLAGHALYKGALFMAAGAIDHGTGTRDVTKLGGLWKDMRITSVAILLASVSMAGIPVTLGYLGKETFVAAGLDLDGWSAALVTATVVSGVLALAAASLLVVRPLFDRAHPDGDHHAHEGTPGLWLGPMVLGVASWVLAFMTGAISSWVFTPAASATGGAPIKVSLHIIPEDTNVLL
ncbi:MAG TPA: proton-conducting transporter membrane subunit, partial [Tepidiformaceae bacterium]|nr:proton-conducting transporter membrane subunit [Tepidiformaceae bacterium]